MKLHSLTSEGTQVVDDVIRLVVCDDHDQPLVIFVHMGIGGPVMVVKRGDPEFDRLVELTGIGRPAATVDLNLAVGATKQ